MPEVKDDLSDEAWRLITSLVKTGKATLDSGATFCPEDRELTGLIKWVASLRAQRRKTVSRPEDFLVPVERKETGDAPAGPLDPLTGGPPQCPDRAPRQA